MTTTINFSDRDWRGRPIATERRNVTGSITHNGNWTVLNVGGLNDIYPLHMIEVMGNATSPASFGGTDPDDTAIYLDIAITQNGAPPPSTGSALIRYPIIKWLTSQTSTVKETVGVRNINLNTINPRGNIYYRLSSNPSLTFTSANFLVVPIRTTKDNFPSEVSFFNTTNNLTTITGVAGGNTNTVQEIPASTTGYFEGRFTQFGHFGDIKTELQIGLSPTASILDVNTKYMWRYQAGDATGNDPKAEVIHNFTSLGEISCVEGDILTVNRSSGGTITYLKNGVVFATGGTTDTTAMKGKVNLVRPYGRALGLRMDIGAGSISPTWENKVNIQEF